jgi:uncharacterized peroxidase-related enzyme
MTFIETVAEDEATGAVAEVYANDREAFGFLPNFTGAFSLRPAVYAAWRQLNGAIKSGMDLRRYELATIAAARRLRSSYCMLAHGSVLINQFLDPQTVQAVATDHRAADLIATDVAIMDFAEKIVHDATSIGQPDIDRLRSSGLSDADILEYSELDPEVRDVLTVVRAIAER